MPTHRSNYFAYGSNMDSAQMKTRCKSARLDGHGILTGFRFLINSRGIASIVGGKEATVHGLVWSVTDADLANLDRYEGVRQGYYSRTTASVVVEENTVTAWIYVASDNTEGRPRPGYLERIIAAARLAGFPDAYVEELERAA
jgi:gamma-glutamylcyclotransferase (GGCT)/AIG2-like uncharacterized protein YtfP